MKKAGLRELPFSPEQTEHVCRELRTAGFEPVLLDTDTYYPDDCLSDCEILFGYFPKRMLERARAMKWYQLPCAGADRYVDPGLYPHADFTLTNSSGAFGAAIAEHLLMGALMLLRRYPEYGRQQREKVWARTGNIRLIRDCNVTILGTGNLGGSFARCVSALGAQVYGICRSGKSEESGFDEIAPVDACTDMLSKTDILAACLPLTKETEGILNREFFEQLPHGCIFLNCGRGKTVVQKDLIDALSSGRLSGALLDVAETEPMPPDCPLWEMENVIITPHVSGSDLDPCNGEIIQKIFLENLRLYVSGEKLRNVVDRRAGY